MLSEFKISRKFVIITALVVFLFCAIYSTYYYFTDYGKLIVNAELPDMLYTVEGQGTYSSSRTFDKLKAGKYTITAKESKRGLYYPSQYTVVVKRRKETNQNIFLEYKETNPNWNGGETDFVNVQDKD